MPLFHGPVAWLQSFHVYLTRLSHVLQDLLNITFPNEGNL